MAATERVVAEDLNPYRRRSASSSSAQSETGCLGYFTASTVHSRNFDVLVAMTRLFAQRWQTLSGNGMASGSAGRPFAPGFIAWSSVTSSPAGDYTDAR